MKKPDRERLRWSQIGLIALCVFLALVLLGMIFATAYVDHFLAQIHYIPMDTTLSPEAIASIEQNLTETVPPDYTGAVINPTDIPNPPGNFPTLIQHPDIVNFLLVGQDRRPGQGRQRSDSMIVITFNKRNRTITLTSFLRDMYVDIPGFRATKMNAAYERGGFSMLCDTLLQNFGVVIDGCIEVDFDGFASVVDLVGGVDIDLTAAEAKHLNEGYGWTLTKGVNHLDGEKALAYSRVRAIGNDYARTQRQRTVLTKIIEGCKNLSFFELSTLLNNTLPLISTTMTSNEISNYLLDLFPMLSGSNVRALRIPADGTFTEAMISSGVGDSLVPDLEKNRQLLIQTLLPK